MGVPRHTLMENAGRGAATVLQRLYPRGEVVAAVGGGNNGGDALVLLRTLASWGRPVRALLVADRSDDDVLLHGWHVPVIRDSDFDDGEALELRLRGAGVLVDGILGTGIRGAPRERQARAVRALNRADAPVLALDVPSGVNADTGAAPGDAVEAEVTVAFGWPKLGTLLSPGRERAGRLIAVEIGFPPLPDGSGTEGDGGITDEAREGGDAAPPSDPPPFGARLATPAWASAHRPGRPAQAHKYSVGSLLLHAGREGMAGAAVMAARAALRSGVGLLRVASDPENRVILQERVPEAIYVDVGDTDAVAEAVGSVDAVAAGPGIGTDEAGERALRAVLEGSEGRPLVLDADALTLLGEEGAGSLSDLGAIGPVLVTPHPGEMARISAASRERIRERPLDAARELAADSGCAVLLKGLPSVVASPDGSVLVDTQSTSALATAGMGDVLTGVCGSFLAQGVASTAVAGALGLYHSGRAAVVADLGAGLSPEDVVSHLPEVLREAGPGTTDLDLPFVVFDGDAPR